MSDLRMSNRKRCWSDLKKIKVFVFSLVSTEVLTRPYSPSRPVHKDTISIPPRDIPEQLAAYS